MDYSGDSLGKPFRINSYQRLSTLNFSHIFIDEAGQSSEGEIWLSLSLATPETSIILCGDPRQLGPVIPLDISRTLQESFTSPLFRYMRMKAYRTDT